MKLVNYNDPILTQPCEEFNWAAPQIEDILEFSKEFVKFMYDNNGIGLSAPQIGLSLRIFAMRGEPENFVVINPRIVDATYFALRLTGPLGRQNVPER